MKVLVFAPHNDDEVLGVGGTIAKYTQSGNQVIVCEVTSGSNENIVKKIKNMLKIIYEFKPSIFETRFKKRFNFKILLIIGFEIFSQISSSNII